MRLEPEAIAQLVSGGSITADQALGVVLRALKTMDGTIDSDDIPSKLLNPTLVASIQQRSNDDVIAKIRAWADQLPEDDDVVQDALADLKRNEDETVLLVLATLHHLLVTPPADSDWMSAMGRQDDLLTRILNSLLPIIVVEDSKEALNLATIDLTKLKRGTIPLGAVTKDIQRGIIDWIKGMCDNLGTKDVPLEILCPPDPEFVEPTDEELFKGPSDFRVNVEKELDALETEERSIRNPLDLKSVFRESTQD